MAAEIGGQVDPTAEDGFTAGEEIEVKDLFADVCDLPAGERAEMLQARCGANLKLRGAVQELLDAYDQAGPFLANPTNPVPPSVAVVGQRIDQYLILKEIGEGGFGTVYVAEQSRPVRRNVAMKIIKLGMDTRAVIARFEAERQALAMMDHPNIARMFDAGATETGRPYFVMELIDGVPITDYCDANHLTLRQRLELFVPVCQAVQHAHQKGIIHRDLKPSNVLILQAEGMAVPKVIDFGVAKAIQARLTGATLFTESGQLIGTPEYMSPEQADTGGSQVDTRSDIYSLGVLLYELMTGSTPIDAKVLRAKGYAEIQRSIREMDPVRPSIRVSVLGQTQSAAAAIQGVDPRQLGRYLRHELDWIVMKCLEKDRNRRYATASELAQDIRRHLDNRSVLAAPPGTMYLLSKWFYRNRTLALSVAAVLAIIVIATAVYIHGIRLAEQRTEQALIDTKKAMARANAEQVHSALVQARAAQFSIEAGRRFDSLAALAAAARIDPSVQVRSQAVASLALADLRIAREWRSADRSICFNHAGDMYADMTRAGEVLIYATPAVGSAPAAPLLRLPGRCSGPRVCFNPDDKQVAVAQTDGRVCIFDIAGRWRAAVIGGPGFDFLPDGSGIVASLSPSGVAVYDLPSGALRRRFSWPATDTVSVSPDGRRLAIWSTFEASRPDGYIGDLGSGQLASLRSPARPAYLGWHPDSSQVAAACVDFNTHIWDVHDLDQVRQTATLRGQEGVVIQSVYSHGGDLLATCGWDGCIRLWNVVTGEQLVRLFRNAWNIHFSPDDRMLLATQDDGYHLIVDVANGRECRTVLAPTGYRTREIAFNHDGSMMACGGGDCVRVWNMAAGGAVIPAADCLLPMRCLSVAFLPDDHGLIASTDSGVWKLDAQRNSVRPRHSDAGGGGLRVIADPKALYARSQPYDGQVDVSRDGSRIAVTGWQCPTLILDPTGASKPLSLSGSEDAMFMSLSPDGKRVATGSWHGVGNHRVGIWSAATGALLTWLPVDRDATVRFSPDNRLLLTATDTECRLWDTTSWKCLRTFPRELSTTATLGFSPDSRTLAFSPRLRGIRLVNVQSGTELATFGDDEQPVGFSPDGETLAAIYGFTHLRLYNLRLIRSQLAAMGLDWPRN